LSARATILQKRGRDRLDVICEILETALDGALRTQIMYKVSLNFGNLNSYLRFLKERKFLEEKEENGNRVLRTTKKGVHYIQAYQSIRHLLIAQRLEIEKMTESAIETQSIPIAEEKALSTKDQFELISLRLTNLEEKIDKIYAELKRKSKLDEA